MRFRLLGPLEIWDGQAWHGLNAPKWRALLATLLINANHVVPVDQLIDELWRDNPPSGATNQIHGLVARVRRALNDREGRVLTTRAPGYLLAVSHGDLDVAEFERLAEQGRQATRDGDPVEGGALLRRALDLWRGRALADIPLTPLVDGETARLDELRAVALEARIDADLACGGRYDELITELRRLVKTEPLRERHWAQLMLAQHHTGRSTDALRTYERLRHSLATSLGVDPSAQTRAVFLRVLRDNAEAPDPDRPDPAEGADRPTPAQLPADLATFSGRDAELAQLAGARTSYRDAPAIMAFDGMAGVGKTALAVHWAHRLRHDYPDGQLFLDLHGFTPGTPPVTPADALHRLLHALGIPDDRIPPNPDDRAALYRGQTAGRRLLIVLDNAVAEDQVRPLIPATSSCLVLITSRRRLTGLDGVEPVSLDVPPRSDAVTLFVRTASDVRLAGEPAGLVEQVVELCGRLPLAICLAAARLRSRPRWSLAHLVTRLRDRQGRLAQLGVGRQSVAAAFQVSYSQLDAGHQRLFRLLGLHPGRDVERYAAAALAGISVDRADQLLEHFLDTHLLIQHTPGRYTFHHLLRAYAVDLATVEETEAERRTALTRLFDHYTRTAAVAVATRASRWLDSEHANLVAVALHAAEYGWPDRPFPEPPRQRLAGSNSP